MDADLHRTMLSISTGTITTILLKKGIRRTFMRGPRPLMPGAARVVGPAFTLRFVPAREDLATPQSWSSPQSTRAAIEAMPAGVIAVADGLGVTDCGIFGDILCARMRERQVAALVTDGAVRDLTGIEQVALPVWCAGVAAPPSVAGLTFINWQEPIGCGGVAVIPGDVVVADADGAVVIPAALVEEVAKAGVDQERLETWILGEVRKGNGLLGLYPANAATLARYEAESKGK
jgi:regulator of RNase E activity RraA